jgi:hypothetical protein
LKVRIEVPNCDHIVEWLRFIIKNRPKHRFHHKDLYVFDFCKVEFIFPYHLVSMACLMEEYKLSGAKIRILSDQKSQAGKFIRWSKFENYWGANFDRNFCLNSRFSNTLPIWKYRQEYIDSFALIAEKFYSNHAIKGKDLSPLRLTVVEALNNITDHSESKVSGFVATQYFKGKSELVISICDFGKGIPNRVNLFQTQNKRLPMKDNLALEEALKRGFSTKSTPRNRGFGLDTILSTVKAVDGEIEIVSNRAYFSKKMINSQVNKVSDQLEFSFPGTYLVFKMNMNKFQEIEAEYNEEVSLF